MKNKTFERMIYCNDSIIKVLFFLLIIVLSSCSSSRQKTEDYPAYEGPISETINFELLYSDSARIIMKLNAPVRLEYENQNQSYPQGILLNFYKKTGENEARLTAKVAYYDKSTGVYTAEGNVVVQNLIENRKLITEKLHWDPIHKKFYTDSSEFVQITTPKELLKGYGLESMQDMSWYHIWNPKGVFPINQ